MKAYSGTFIAKIRCTLLQEGLVIGLNIFHVFIMIFQPCQLYSSSESDIAIVLNIMNRKML